MCTYTKEREEGRKARTCNRGKKNGDEKEGEKERRKVERIGGGPKGMEILFSKDQIQVPVRLLREGGVIG